jgi:hypothetical protein
MVEAVAETYFHFRHGIASQHTNASYSMKDERGSKYTSNTIID